MTENPTPPEKPYERTSGPVHTWFGLSYSNYQVLHRSLMQSMPVDWQRRMVGCLEELHDAFQHVEQAPGYLVTPARDCYLSEMSDADLAATGFSVTSGEDETVYYDDAGNEISEDEASVWHVMVPAGDDPVPHYNGGRTYIEPEAS